jgi:hypothetical protein
MSAEDDFEVVIPGKIANPVSAQEDEFEVSKPQSSAAGNTASTLDSTAETQKTAGKLAGSENKGLSKKEID